MKPLAEIHPNANEYQEGYCYYGRALDMFWNFRSDGKSYLDEILKEQGIGAVFHYVPLHQSTIGEKLGYRAGDLPVTEDRAARLLRLPFFYEISDAQQTRVAETIREFFEK